MYKANEDIKVLTDNGVKIYDLMYNLMYDGKRIKVIDTADFWRGNANYLDNVNGFNEEIKMFLVDCYFNNIVLNDVIMIDDLVAGYTHSYFEGKNFCDFNDPFGVNLDNLSYAVARANEDIKLLSRRKVEINDLLYNLMFDEKRIKVIDTFEFRKGDITYLENVEDLNNEIKMFLVDGYFENIVLDNKRLYKTYYDNSISALTFLKLFRKYLEKIKNQEIKYLSDARDLANTDFGEGRYRRNYSKKRFLLR